MKIDFRMANYPGMNLTNEIRESISLDEDDLSDVEDEVFIRDGKNSFKTAEEIYAKRPLMAPRRRNGNARPNNFSRIKNKPPFRAFCKPCCYFLTSLSVLIGLIILVIVLVSIFPLPLDRIHSWILSKFTTLNQENSKILPCASYKITDVWTLNLPKLTTDSPIYLIDINQDGIEDAVFGFGTGENDGILPPNLFCNIFLHVQPPCDGGLIALNGLNGEILWRHWTNDSIFFIHCSEDLNGDQVNDCLIFGTKGTISVVNMKNGTALWTSFYTDEEIIMGNFISDQNNDKVADVLASQTNLLEAGGGHILLLSGKTGEVIQKIGIGAKTFYTPQILRTNNKEFILFGTGGPSTAGNLSIAPLNDFLKGAGKEPIENLYSDPSKGMLIESLFVDINGDSIPDIITAMFNSTIIAFDGKNHVQLWNFTLKNSQTDSVPIPGNFNFDNITDLLIIYQTYDEILHYNYTQTYILDGKTGNPIYEKPISDSVDSQIGGIAIGSTPDGYDSFVFWTSECKSVEVFKKIDFPVRGITVHPLYENCRHQENTTVVLKLNILNQFDQPPGVEIYNSLNRTLLEFNNTKSPMQIVKEYFKVHGIDSNIPAASRVGQAETNEGYENIKNQGKIGVHKYGNSNFRHKDNRKGLLKEFSNPDNYEAYPELETQKQPYNPYYRVGTDDLDYNAEDELTPRRDQPMNYMMKKPLKSEIRDPRYSKTKRIPKNDEEVASTTEFSITDTIFDYKNVKLAKNRLLHDLSNSPIEILSDTFYKNLENRLRTSKFEQRDLIGHSNKKQEEESINKIIEAHRKSNQNTEYNLWKLESESEEKSNNFNWRSERKKRDLLYSNYGSLRKSVSVGAIADSLNPVKNDSKSNSVDLIFLTFWQPLKYEPRKNLEEELAECVEEKLSNKTETGKQEERIFYFDACVKEQENLKEQFPYFSDVYKLNLGQMTVYRLKIECQCNLTKKNEQCAKFSPKSEQKWPSYLGVKGNGVIVN